MQRGGRPPDLDEPGSTIARTFGFLTGTCPLLYQLSCHELGLLPEPVRITTNKLAEHWIVSPLLLAGLAYFLWRAAGPALMTAGTGLPGHDVLAREPWRHPGPPASLGAR